MVEWAIKVNEQGRPFQRRSWRCAMALQSVYGLSSPTSVFPRGGWKNRTREFAMKNLISFLLVLTPIALGQTARRLPNCPGTPSALWNDCIGTFTAPNGDKFVGEYHNNLMHGQGTYEFATGTKYVGEFDDGEFSGHGALSSVNGDSYVGEFHHAKLNGQGTYTSTTGTKYVGTFRNGKYDGWGTLTSPNGARYIGEFHNGKYDGQGTLMFSNGKQQEGLFIEGDYIGPSCPKTPTSYWDKCVGRGMLSNGDSYVAEFREGKGYGTHTFSNGDKYVGEFRDGALNGQGVRTYANGEKYVGEFRDGKEDGKGTRTFADGGRQVGEFRDGHYIGRSTSPMPVQPGGSSTFEVRLEIQGGVLRVPVSINNTLTLSFIIDSGCSDVSIPEDVVSTLERMGTLIEADFTGTKTYILADGSTIPSKTFRIRSLRVGDKTLENVSGSVAPSKGALLLGQSFLNRFKSWSIDNARQVLVLLQ